MKKENILYGLFGVIAVLVCWYYNIEHMDQGGGFVSFVTQNHVNPASSSIFYDILFLFITITIWMGFEAFRLKIKYWWMYIFIGLFIGVSFSFPVFLIHRNIKLKNIT